MNGVADLGTVLGIWAHPDDEAYLMGGTMAAAAAAGQHVACVTATLGEQGETADAHRWPRERLGDIRRVEMADSLEVLGVHDHQWLDHHDGSLSCVDPGVGVDQVRAAIDRVRPDTVMTFGPDGMTGHPDHSTISAWTVAAAGSSDCSPVRVLASTKTDQWAEQFADINAEVFPYGPPITATADLALSIVLDDDTLDRKVRALECQASQTTDIIAALGRERFAEWARAEDWVEIDR